MGENGKHREPGAEGQVLAELSNGDRVRRFYKGIILDFAGKRKTVSTSVLNGGSREDLAGVFNYNCLAEEMAVALHEETYEKELRANAKSLGLPPDAVTGLSTAAWMEMASVQRETFRDLEICAVVTGGVDANATRVCDPASYYEESGDYHRLEPGTINILLHFNCNMPIGTLTRAMTTAVEAKVTAVEELLIGSRYSSGLATGSGTDGLILVCDAESDNYLTDAGEHGKLGELIGIVVKRAVKDSLYRQTGAGAPRQHKLTVRVQRYGITEGSLWEFYEKNRELFRWEETPGQDFDIRRMEYVLDAINGNSTVVVWASLYVHILDQLEWGMLEWAEALRETKAISVQLWERMDVGRTPLLYEVNPLRDVLDELVRQMMYVILVLILKIQV